jgi:hypothetical protein
MTDDPPARIEVIQKSLRVFACGLPGVVPILGFVPAAYALASWLAVHNRHRTQWNPASVYLTAGLVLAVFGLLSSGITITVILIAISMSLFG